MKTRLFALAVLLSLLLVPSASQAQSGTGFDRFTDELQPSTQNPIAHWMFDDWLIGAPAAYWNPALTTLNWVAESNGEPYWRAAIDSWNGYIPRAGLWWTETEGGPWDVGVWNDTDPCNSAHANACFVPVTVVNDNTRKARRWKTADVWYEWEVSDTADMKRRTMRHEIGHIHGLADRYATGGGCHSETTVMDRAGCDGFGLHNQDITNFQHYYRYGETWYNGSGYIPGNQVWYAWLDHNWNEWHLEVTFFWSTDRVNWNPFYTQYVTNNIGTVYAVQQRSIVSWVKPSNWGVHNKWITACARPYVGRDFNDNVLYGHAWACPDTDVYWNE